MRLSLKSKVTVRICTLALLAVAGITFCTGTASAKNYTVRVSTKPCNTEYTKLKTYNAKTKQYYMLRSYLEKLQKDGGGTLTIKKGTYKIPCTLYVPSNVTIKLKTGVVLKKTVKTGSKKLTASNTMFELVNPSQAEKKNASKKYKGAKNISFIGNGTAAINMNNADNSTGIVAGHNNNVTISGITFKKMRGGSYITLAASKKVGINKCTFSGYTEGSVAESKYAIRLEVPDKTTGAFPYVWSKTDKTVNNNINISENVFENICSGVGSIKYTDKKYHQSVSITGNRFDTISEHAIRPLNWNAANISSNTFSNIASGTGLFCGVYASGVIDPVITGNVFDMVPVPIQITAAANTGLGKGYPATYNTIPESSVTGFGNNTVTNALKYYVVYQPALDASSAVRLAYFMDYTTRDYVIKPGITPYHDYYTDDKWYNEYTKDSYVFRSYLEQLERVGGGTLTVEAGDYSLTNTQFVPSNVTIYFQHGVNIKKGNYTGFAANVLAPSLSLFQLVPPSLSNLTGAVGGYNGSHDVAFIGRGTVNIDLLFYNNVMAIVMGHNRNVTIQGINFRNYMGHHFIELDASQNVTIQGCSFAESSFTSSKDDGKEAINIDIPDKNTGGFNQIWTNYDRTPNDTVIIKNNSFVNTLRAIGTHKYSVSALDNTTQIYHNNIQILDNNILNTHSYAIRSMNWKDCIIKGNLIKNVNSGNTTAILMSGAVNPTITENTFDTAAHPITLNPASSANSTTADKYYPVSYTKLDSEEETGVNLSAMLNNKLIDMSKVNQILYYKEVDGKAIKYKYDSANISYTYPTATPTPTKAPTASPEPGVTPDPNATPEPTDTPEPEPDYEV